MFHMVYVCGRVSSTKDLLDFFILFLETMFLFLEKSVVFGSLIGFDVFRVKFSRFMSLKIFYALI